MYIKSKLGFTLIESLVVIAIIGLLASIVLVWLADARVQARDTKRLAEVDTLRQAIELHYTDHNQHPQATDWTKIEEDADTNGPFSQAMKPYLPVIPRDPLYPKIEDEKVFSYQYKSTQDQQGYKIHIEMETEVYAFYEVYSGGGGSEIVYSAEAKITLTSPNGGESWKEGDTYDITWTSSRIEEVNLDLKTFAELGEPSMLISTVATNIPASLGKYSWEIPLGTTGVDRAIIIYETADTTLDTSDNPFTIIGGETCDQKCKSQGYQSGICRSFGIGPTAESCEAGEVDIGQTSDCYFGGLGVEKTCCCSD